MEALTEKIRASINLAKPALMKMPSDNVSIKPARQEWSKKEILGHLIDSALNNHQRCVRGGCNAAEQFPPYNQTRWVEIQGYQERDWMELVNFWELCNQHLCQVLDRLDEKDLGNLCNIGKDTPATLGFVMEDYLRHLKMHLDQILEGSA